MKKFQVSNDEPFLVSTAYKAQCEINHLYFTQPNQVVNKVIATAK